MQHCESVRSSSSSSSSDNDIEGLSEEVLLGWDIGSDLELKSAATGLDDGSDDDVNKILADCISKVNCQRIQTELGIGTRFLAFSQVNMAPAYKDIFEAAENDDENAVKWYIEEGGVLPNRTNNHEHTAAHIAARKGNLNIVKYVLEKDPSILNIYRGMEVFQQAIKYGNLPVVKYLVEELKLSIEKRFSNRFYGNTAIHLATQYTEMEVLKYFLEERNGNVNVENDVMQTPLFEAIERRCHPIIKYLIEERGADMNKLDYMQDSILDKAIKHEDFVILKYFIHDRKMNYTIRWRNEQTHLAASFGGVNLMEFILKELNGNVNTADEWGKTPLHLAADDNHYEMCKYLLEHGADPNLRDVDGQVALDGAQWENVTALLAAVTAPRTRRSVFEPVHLMTAGSTTTDVERRHPQLLREETDRKDGTRENLNHALQNFLLIARIGLGKSVDRIRPLLPGVEDMYDRHFAHLAVEAALDDHQRFEGV